MTPVLMQILSLTGAILVLIGFGGQQYAGMKSDGMTYGLLNFVGSLLLASSAIAPLNAGVLVLEGTWALISLNVMIRSTRGRRRD
jgi:hypothetical protein